MFISAPTSDNEPYRGRQNDRRRALAECVGELGVRQQELIKAIYEDGIAIKNVAERLGRSPTGLFKALARIRNRLALCIRTKLGVFGPEGET